MIREVGGGEHLGEAVGDFRQHGRVPGAPVGHHAVERRALAVAEVAALLDAIVRQGQAEPEPDVEEEAGT